MALSIVSGEAPPDLLAAMDDLQREQFDHDETYHREIARLPMQSRLRHMALHFAKYSGNLVEAQRAGADAEIQRIVVDVLIIGMSTANTLNFRLSCELSGLAGSQIEVDEFAGALAVGAGKMAAACEKLDHVEDYPFRATLRSATVDLVRAAAQFASGRCWDLRKLVHHRLKPVKERFIHHDRAGS